MFDQFGVILSKSEVGPLMPKSIKNVDDFKNPVEILRGTLLSALTHDALLEIYEIPDFDNYDEFLDNIAKKNKFLIKKGYVDSERAAREVLKDIIEGKVRYETSIEN